MAKVHSTYRGTRKHIIYHRNNDSTAWRVPNANTGVVNIELPNYTPFMYACFTFALWCKQGISVSDQKSFGYVAQQTVRQIHKSYKKCTPKSTTKPQQAVKRIHTKNCTPKTNPQHFHNTRCCSACCPTSCITNKSSGQGDHSPGTMKLPDNSQPFWPF